MSQLVSERARVIKTLHVFGGGKQAYNVPAGATTTLKTPTSSRLWNDVLRNSFALREPREFTGTLTVCISVY